MRAITVVTTSRADYGIYTPLLSRLRAEPDIELRLLAAGMHIPLLYGHTIAEIENDGYEVQARIDCLLASDGASAASKAIGIGILGFAQELERSRPDVLVVLGDRFEMFAAAAAALPLRIPVAHIHGGEISEGAIDDAFRHAMTKLSHLHFVSTESAYRRVVQLGEEPWRVTRSGAPALDLAAEYVPLSREDVRERFGIDLPSRFLLVTVHPETLGGDVSAQTEELLAALSESGLPCVFTMPNADPGGMVIRRMLSRFVAARGDSVAVESFGRVGYFSMMSYAAAMVGNSSSGIIEAASFRLPVVNVGIRQRGRETAGNVVTTAWDRAEIAKAIAGVASPRFREGLATLVNPYGDGRASERIGERLRTIPLDEALVRKKFHDLG